MGSEFCSDDIQDGPMQELKVPWALRGALMHNLVVPDPGGYLGIFVFFFKAVCRCLPVRFLLCSNIYI